MCNFFGHHHISMMTKDAKRNNHFYQQVLGMRRVKMTVNQDDPSMYHLFYGDKIGSPGTELTFFEMKNIGQTHPGSNAFTRIGLIVPSIESLRYWRDRFESLDINHSEITNYANRPALPFEDPDGLKLVLQVEPDQGATRWQAWEDSVVPFEHQIRGIGTVEVKVRRIEKFIKTLTTILSYQQGTETSDGIIFQPESGSISGEIIVQAVDAKTERPGRGSIHHLALRVKNLDELVYWEKRVKAAGFITSEVIDRYYFHSLYFRESNGILFELATDGPGFTVDSTVEDLGKTLDLPQFLAHRRAEIEAKLTPLTDA